MNGIKQRIAERLYGRKKRSNKMEALLRAINDLLVSKDNDIHILKWENGKLREEIEELKKDIEKYKENEVNRV